MSDYLTIVEVLAIHDALLDAFGGASGLRDAGALEAALYRPQTGYYTDVVQEAAALFESLLQNHPFVDGNKRVAFAAADVFLRLNGHVLRIEGDAAYSFMIDAMTQRTVSLTTIEAWLRDHLAGA